MSLVHYTPDRHKTAAVDIGGVIVGGGAPIVVQSMTNTDTADVDATVAQIRELADAGSELVRITVNNEAAARAVPMIYEQLQASGYTTPLIGDFHYNGHDLLARFPECAKALAKYRINPGNVGFGDKQDKQFASMIQTAIQYDKPVRIGVNWGSLDKALVAKMMDENAKLAEPKDVGEVTREALIVSAISSAEAAEKLGLARNKILVSCKVSGVQDLISLYRDLASRCNYALHLGLTEAGMGSKGITASAIAMGVLLQDGIGDTIRTSLTPEPGQARTEEVKVCQHILQTMGLRAFNPMVSACPGCGRTTSTVYQDLAMTIQTYLRDSMPKWRKTHPGVENLNVAVMGCIVNGPGESKFADIGISLPGTGESPVAPVFIDGKKAATLRGERIAERFHEMVEAYIAERFEKCQATL